MVEDDQDRQLDAMLDSFLSAYAAAEPRPGLETRIRAGIKARAAQRRRGWMLVFAASAAAVVLATALTRLYWFESTVPDHVVALPATPGSGSPPAPGATPPSRLPVSVRRTASPRHPSVAVESSRLLLQAANSISFADQPVFEREKIYLAPAAQPQPDVTPETPGSTPSIDIQDLGVQSIEIKELPSAKSTDSKGDL